MELLKRLYEISSPSKREYDMIDFIRKQAKSLGVKCTRDIKGNLYITKGKSDTYPCIAAHMDEVHDRRQKGYEVVVHKSVIFGFDIKQNSFAGIGADDKNGIWVALKCLKKYDVLKCVFFVGEEIGCVGSSAANMNFFDDCRFVVQCDRKGSNDLITKISFDELCSKEFVKALDPQKYGYKEANGMMTDVHELKTRGLGISCINMSCGYYEPHTNREYTIIDDLLKCLHFVEHIIKDCTEVYSHEYVETFGVYGRYGKYADSRTFWGDDDYYSSRYPGYKAHVTPSTVIQPANLIHDATIQSTPIKTRMDDLIDKEEEISYEYLRQYDDMESDVENALIANGDLYPEDLYAMFAGKYPELTLEDFYQCYGELMCI